MDPAVNKYLSKYAEPEANLSYLLRDLWECALIVPVRGESVDALDGLRAALQGTEARSLLILVVNASPDTAPEICAENSAFMADIATSALERHSLSTTPPASLIRFESFDVLLVDRSTSPWRLPIKQGVGLARKIGCDLALALHVGSKLSSPWFFSSDADAKLPATYFAQAAAASGRRHSALVYRFFHERSSERSLDVATQLYELSLRYYVAGLSFAGSPYAFHTIGSSLAVFADSYAKVRGFPKRLAGEDFYVLDKLAKVEPVLRLRGEAIAIRARRSVRTPFGTGRGIARIETDRRLGRETLFYHPEAFEALRIWLDALDSAIRERNADVPLDALAGLRPALRDALRRVLVELEVREMLKSAISEARDSNTLARRVHTWFDAFRTLKFLHRLRDIELASLPWTSAIAEAPFCPALSDSAEPSVVSGLLEQKEQTLSGPVGLTLSPIRGRDSGH